MEFIQTISDTQKRASSHNGHGLFTTVERAQGSVLVRLGGEIVAHEDDFDLLSTTEWNALDNDTILLRRTRTSYYMINHSHAANLTINPLTHDLSAKVAIDAGSELLLNYLENGFPQAYLQTERCAYLR
jgi:hypothetical protein